MKQMDSVTFLVLSSPGELLASSELVHLPLKVWRNLTCTTYSGTEADYIILHVSTHKSNEYQNYKDPTYELQVVMVALVNEHHPGG